MEELQQGKIIARVRRDHPGIINGTPYLHTERSACSDDMRIRDHMPKSCHNESRPTADEPLGTVLTLCGCDTGSLGRCRSRRRHRICCNRVAAKTAHGNEQLVLIVTGRHSLELRRYERSRFALDNASIRRINYCIQIGKFTPLAMEGNTPPGVNTASRSSR